LEPTNPLPKFQRATLLLQLNQPDRALAELHAVALVSPREAAVQFLMGKIYKKLGRLDLAMVRFVRALDLDPKDRNLVKAGTPLPHKTAPASVTQHSTDVFVRGCDVCVAIDRLHQEDDEGQDDF
jgi:tetratricopeptide (TPR) repeat protein